MSDFRVNDHGSIILISPQSDACKEWFAEHVFCPDYMVVGDAHACDHRMFGRILDGLINAGFEGTQV